MNLELLRRLTQTPGVCGREERVRELLEMEVRPIFDQVRLDAMGSLIAVRKGPRAAQRLLLACHIDEIGFYVSHIDDRGFLRLQNVGGFDMRNLFSRRVLVQASEGGDLTGLLQAGGRPIHIARDEEKKKVPELGEFFVDLCLPAEEVKKRVRVGDPVTLAAELAEVGECVVGKSLDNRVAGFVAVEALRKVRRPRFEVALALTVQEEVGCRGAGPAAFAVEPDIAIAIDTTLCVDTPGLPQEERVSVQGQGVALTVLDSGSISDRRLIDEFAAIARRRKIPFQLSILPRGTTDAATMQRSRSGHRSMTYSIPTRYIHTTTETIHKTDLAAAIDLLAAFLETQP